MSGHSQRVLAALRELIVKGELAPGQRVAEIPLAGRLGVSRTPVREAFKALEQEGLLSRAGGRGYLVREIDATAVADAIEVRAVLEGLAARLCAERRLARGDRDTLLECLALGDRLFAAGYAREADLEAYHGMNLRFHQTLVRACGNAAVAEALARNNHLPLGWVGAIAFDRDALESEFDRFRFAHMQHHIVFEAVDNGQGARAEAMMREHANAALRYAAMFRQSQSLPENVRVLGGRARGYP